MLGPFKVVRVSEEADSRKKTNAKAVDKRNSKSSNVTLDWAGKQSSRPVKIIDSGEINFEIGPIARRTTLN
jgi:hypothetical protein